MFPYKVQPQSPGASPGSPKSSEEDVYSQFSLPGRSSLYLSPTLLTECEERRRGFAGGRGPAEVPESGKGWAAKLFSDWCYFRGCLQLLWGLLTLFLPSSI